MPTRTPQFEDREVHGREGVCLRLVHAEAVPTGARSMVRRHQRAQDCDDEPSRVPESARMIHPFDGPARAIARGRRRGESEGATRRGYDAAMSPTRMAEGGRHGPWQLPGRWAVEECVNPQRVSGSRTLRAPRPGNRPRRVVFFKHTPSCLFPSRGGSRLPAPPAEPSGSPPHAIRRRYLSRRDTSGLTSGWLERSRSRPGDAILGVATRRRVREAPFAT